MNIFDVENQDTPNIVKEKIVTKEMENSKSGILFLNLNIQNICYFSKYNYCLVVWLLLSQT